MTEVSRFWNGTSVGDAVLSPYEADTVFSDVLRLLSRTMGFVNQGAVITSGGTFGISGATSPVTVQDGYAIVWGTWYRNDAPIVFTVPTPAVSTRIDRIVLRKDWVAQTVRMVLVSGIEGGGEPALTQVVGTTWDIPLCKVSITTGGAITLTDEREFMTYAGGSVFVPWTAVGPLPSVRYNAGTTGAGGVLMTLPNTVPPNATAVVLSAALSSGTCNGFNIATPVGGVTTVFGLRDGAVVDPLRTQGIIPIPPSFPRQFQFYNLAAIDVTFYVVGWYVPTP